MKAQRDGVTEAVIGLAAAHDPAQLEVLLESLSNAQLRSLAASLAARVATEQQPRKSLSAPEQVCEVAVAAAAKTFGTTPEAVLSPARAQEVSDARAVAMTAARANGLSVPKIAEYFGKDHASVLHALKRTAERPRLTAEAASIADDITSRYQKVTQERPALRLVRDSKADPKVDQKADPKPGRGQATPAEVTRAGAAIEAAAKTFKTTPEALRGPKRTRTLSDARAVAMTAARYTGISLPKIAAEFGGRDHTTVLHATRRIEKTPPLREIAERIAKYLPAAEDPGTSQPASRLAGRLAQSPGPGERVKTSPARGQLADRQAAVAAATQPVLAPRR